MNKHLGRDFTGTELEDMFAKASKHIKNHDKIKCWSCGHVREENIFGIKPCPKCKAEN